MAVNQIEGSTRDLLKEVERLNPHELEHFVSAVLDLQAQRIAPSLPPAEGELLAQISQGSLPPDKHRRYHDLRQKLRDDSNTAEEYAELLRLSDESEIRNASRLEAIGRLAQLRGKSFHEMMDELGIRPCTQDE